jgi:superfamily II DNA or RNA helicase
MSKALTVHVKEAFFVPISQLTEDEVQQAIQDGTFQFFKDSQCERCEFYQDRPTDTCEGCPANQGIVRTVKRVTKKDRPYLSLPLGYPRAVKRLADGREVEYRVHFPIVPMRSTPEFTGKLWHYQTPAVKSLIEKKRGVLKSKPRTGKTVMAAAAICKLRLKTIILAAQHDWLANFYETFVGSESQKAMTTISKKRCGFARKLEDFEKYDVALATYQQFLSPKGQKLLKKISSMFSVLVLDECHRGAAVGHARVIAQLATKYRWGLSGTPQRKDNKHVIMHRLMGPVVHTTEVKTLQPRLIMVKTGISPRYEYKTWTPAVRFIEMTPKRQSMIAKWAVRDVEKNNHLVLIPLSRVQAIRQVTKLINQIAGRKIAAEFYGGVKKKDRDELIQRARAYNLKVLVGQSKLISTGINIPRASCIYQCTPSSNMPNAEQRFGRILTPYENKPQPLIRVFADDMNIVKACFRSEWWGCVFRLFRPQMTDDTREALMKWMSTKARKPNTDFRAGGSI